jgi:hypothetical protein
MQEGQHASRGTQSLLLLALGTVCLGFVVVADVAAGTLSPNSALHRSTGMYYVAIGVAFVLYCAALAVLRRRRGLLLPVLLVTVVLQAAPLAGPLLLSQDATAYWAYARIAAIDGGNPYSQPPSRFPSDPAYRAVSPVWRNTTSAYGPLFTAGSEGAAVLAGRSASSATMFFKIAAALGVVVLAALAALLSPRPAFAAAVVGWNPLLAVHFAGGGHNDVWMMAPLLGALALEERGRRQLAGALWAVAAAIKWIPLLFLPLRIKQVGRRFGSIGFAVTAAVLAALASVRFGFAWLNAFAPITHDLQSGDRTSAAHLLRGLGISRAVATPLLVGGCGLVYLVLVRPHRGGRIRLGLAAGLLLVATPWLLPWYLAWALPLAAAENDSVALGLSLTLSGYLLEARAPI